MSAGVTVTQEARIAAANHALDNSLIYSKEYTAILAGGGWDQWPLVQAFARFEAETRLATEAAVKAREAELVEALGSARDTIRWAAARVQRLDDSDRLDAAEEQIDAILASANSTPDAGEG